MATLLRKVVAWYRRCCDELGLQPTRSSPAGRDLRDPHWGERSDVHSPLHWGLTASHFRMIMASDYTEGLASVLERWPPHPFAPLPLARGAIETCARVQWMLDPNIDRPTRARRMLAERIAEERWVIGLDGGTAGLKQVQGIAETLAVPLTYNDEGMPAGVTGEPYPTLQRIVPDAIAAATSDRRRLLWHRLAGIAHGSPMGVSAAMTTRSLEMGPDYHAQLHVRSADLVVLTGTVADVFVDTVKVLGARTGWTPHRIFSRGRDELVAAIAALNRRHLSIG